MKKLFACLFFAFEFFCGSAHAQNKLGHIDINNLVIAMPEYKKADTALAEYQNALNQQYSDMVQEFNYKDSLLASKDTARYTRAQLEVKRRDLGQLYLKLQGWNQQAQQLYQKKEADLMNPIMSKAQNAIQQVATANGYTYVFNRNTLAINPPAADDLMPLVKVKLGIR